MKTPEEIEKLATERYGNNNSLTHIAVKGAFRIGYTQCQQDNAETAIKFAEWKNENLFYAIGKKTWISDLPEYSGCAYTIQGLYNQFLTTPNNH